MMKKIVWVMISCLMALSLVMASCGPAAEEEEEVGEELIMPLQMFPQPVEDDGKPQLRFAEDIMPRRRGRAGPKADKSRKKKKGSYAKDTSEEGVKVRKGQISKS